MEEGEESQSLLCSETFSSPTPPSVDSGWNETNGALFWTSHDPNNIKNEESVDKFRDNSAIYSVISEQAYKITNLVKNGQTKDQLLKAALLGGLNAKTATYIVAFEKDINSNFQAKCGIDSQKLVGNDGDRSRRMSGSNGYNGNRMTGTSSGANNDNLNRLSDGQGSQGPPQPQVVPTEGGMLIGRLGGNGGVAVQDVGARSIVTGTVGAGPPASIGGIFRSPQSVSDQGRSYGTAYTTGSAAGASPFSPLYSSHGAGLAPYNTFYSQYPGYNAGMHASLEPQSVSYSAVLQSMGSHAAQSQVPRSPYNTGPSSIGQYPLLSVTHPSSLGQGKPYLQNSSGSLSSAPEREEKYRREQDLDVHRRHSTTGVIQDEKGHHFSVPSAYTEVSRGASLSSAHRESPPQKRDTLSASQEFYKVPYSGREGSLKHRILRPSESGSQGNQPHSAFINMDEPSAKRTKMGTLDLSRESLKGSSSVSEEGPSNLDRERSGSTSGPHLHYPQHFVKGSIIQLANGELKRVEDLETDDFVNSADISNDLKIDSCTVVQIKENRVQGTAVLGFVVGEHKVKVTVEATLEHPFFVFGQGWSSCEPQCTFRRYGLECQRLSVGDVCISLTHKEVTAHAEEISQQQRQQQSKQLEGTSSYSKMCVKSEDISRESPSHRNKSSPGHSHSPSSALYSQGQGYRSDVGQCESSSPHTEGRMFDTSFSPSSSKQIPNSSPSQEQKPHSLAS